MGQCGLCGIEGILSYQVPSIWKGACVSQSFLRLRIWVVLPANDGHDFHLGDRPRVDFINLRPAGTPSPRWFKGCVLLPDIQADLCQIRFLGRAQPDGVTVMVSIPSLVSEDSHIIFVLWFITSSVDVISSWTSVSFLLIQNLDSNKINNWITTLQSMWKCY